MTKDIHERSTPIKSRDHNITTFKDRDDWIELLLAVADLSLGAKVVGARIAHHHNIKTGQCNPTIVKLILGTGMSDSSVRRAIRELEAGGWFRVDRTLGRHSNSYELLAPTLSDATGFNPTTDDRVNPISPDRVQNPTLSPVTLQPCQIEVPNPVTIDRQNHESRTTKERESPQLDLGDAEGRRRKQTPTEPDSTDADFEEFYQAYPKRKSKADALKAYLGARKKGASQALLLTGAMRAAAEYQLDAQRRGAKTAYDFLKYPATWLNKECWNDEGPPIGTSTTIDGDGNPVRPPPQPPNAGHLSNLDRVLMEGGDL
jgi:hypothetical protein